MTGKYRRKRFGGSREVNRFHSSDYLLRIVRVANYNRKDYWDLSSKSYYETGISACNDHQRLLCYLVLALVADFGE